MAAYYAELAQKLRKEAIDSIISKMTETGITLEDISNGLTEEQTTPTLPEAVQTSTAAEPVENNESTQEKPKSAFDDPALDAPYVPKAAKKKAKTAQKTAEKSSQMETKNNDAPKVESDPKTALDKIDTLLDSAEESTSVATEESLSPMEELLSSDPEYKEYYQGKPSGKKKRKMLPMEELLSEPINQLLMMGNTKAKGELYRQCGRIYHSDGIIPTETAVGNTGIYISK